MIHERLPNNIPEVLAERERAVAHLGAVSTRLMEIATRFSTAMETSTIDDVLREDMCQVGKDYHDAIQWLVDVNKTIRQKESYV
jgi:hypothetical protein